MIVAHQRTISYNLAGQINTDQTITKRGSDIYQSTTTNSYGSGTGYALGAVTSATTVNTTNGGSPGSPRTPPTPESEPASG